MTLAPIVIFVYNRLDCLKNTINALLRNSLASRSDIIIYSDGFNSQSENEVKEVRFFLKTITGFRSVKIIERNSNYGLSENVIQGLSQSFKHHNALIILEDDLIISNFFLEYMNTALELYKSKDSVFQISGHQFPLENCNHENNSFFLPMTTSWGWATWKNKWCKFDKDAKGYENILNNIELTSKFNLNNSYPYSNMLKTQMETTKIDSWAIRWWYTVFMHNGITLYPDKSLVNNIGFGENATHTITNPFSEIKFDYSYKISTFPTIIKIDADKFEQVCNLLRNKKNTKTEKISIFNRFINKFTR